MCQKTSALWHCLSKVVPNLPPEQQRSVLKPQRDSSGSNDEVKTAVAVETKTTATIVTTVETPNTFEAVAYGRKQETATIAHFDELPDWMQCDPYIRYGYRRPQKSFRACFWSLFYPHNELVNTWSHLLPASFFLLLLLLSGHPISYSVAHVSRADVAIVHMYICGTMVCLYLSVGEPPCVLRNRCLSLTD